MLKNFGETEKDGRVSSRLYLVFAAGFLLVIVGVLIIAVAAAFGGRASASAGIIVFIGPFPIVAGAGPDAVWLILIGLIIAIISVVMFVIARRKVG